MNRVGADAIDGRLTLSIGPITYVVEDMEYMVNRIIDGLSNNCTLYSFYSPDLNIKYLTSSYKVGFTMRLNAKYKKLKFRCSHDEWIAAIIDMYALCNEKSKI